MNQLQNLFNYEGQQVRTVTMNDEILFVAKDVCDIFGISKYRDAISRLAEKQRESVKVDTPGGIQTMTAITEAGLYKLVFRSNKPGAETFTDWVTEEVLPSIRHTGQYGGPKVLSEREQRIESLKLTLETSQRQDEMQKVLNIHEKQLDELNNKVDEQITLDHREQRRLQKGVGRRVYAFTDDKREAAGLFKELYREIKDRFGVSSYKDLKRKELLTAINYIENWVPRKVS
ncbi:BRO family protein [Bacillus atrophaeus]|uniref:BRO family protein n=1 Tax=Bacillus atrophaeus TaxID=1452 RepID=UPI0007C45883|nr:BRO family protein [Bacillus atrophaeus]WFE15326.1 BRO family protein [Bacillus atrophaeus]